MSKQKFPAPNFTTEQGVTQDRYRSWINGRAAAHRRRDTRRQGKTGHAPPALERYREVIHAAVLRCGGLDEYTGETLDWGLVGTYNNNESETKGAPYKRQFRRLPTIDHVHGDDGRPESLDDLRVCSWEINDAKGDLSMGQFEALCRRVLAGRVKDKATP